MEWADLILGIDLPDSGELETRSVWHERSRKESGAKRKGERRKEGKQWKGKRGTGKAKIGWVYFWKPIDRSIGIILTMHNYNYSVTTPECSCL